MNKFHELKDTGIATWSDLCDSYREAREKKDEEVINMFEAFFVEHGVMTVPPDFFEAIAEGKYAPNEEHDGVVVCYPTNNGMWMWCDCEEDYDPDETPAPNFWDDGMHPLCAKHCYTCATCGKLTQVG